MKNNIVITQGYRYTYKIKMQAVVTITIHLSIHVVPAYPGWLSSKDNYALNLIKRRNPNSVVYGGALSISLIWHRTSV